MRNSVGVRRTIELRQAQIEHHDVGAIGLEAPQRLRAVGRLHHNEPFTSKHVRREIENVRVILDKQNLDHCNLPRVPAKIAAVCSLGLVRRPDLSETHPTPRLNRNAFGSCESVKHHASKPLQTGFRRDKPITPNPRSLAPRTSHTLLARGIVQSCWSRSPTPGTVSMNLRVCPSSPSLRRRRCTVTRTTSRAGGSLYPQTYFAIASVGTTELRLRMRYCSSRNSVPVSRTESPSICSVCSLRSRRSEPTSRIGSLGMAPRSWSERRAFALIRATSSRLLNGFAM